MTDNSLPASNQASGGKVWNPFHKETELPNSPTNWYDKPGPLSLLGLGALVAFIPSAYLAWNIWSSHHDPNRDYISNHVYHMLGGYSNSSTMFYLVPLSLFVGLFIVVSNLISIFRERKPQVKWLAFIESLQRPSIFILFIVVMVVAFASFGDLRNKPIEDKYDSWLKNELQVSKIVTVNSSDIDGKAYQGKDGVYELVKAEKNGYTTFTLKKVDLDLG